MRVWAEARIGVHGWEWVELLCKRGVLALAAAAFTPQRERAVIFARCEQIADFHRIAQLPARRAMMAGLLSAAGPWQARALICSRGS